MKIGIIDSGKGGLAVAKQIKSEKDQLIILLDQGFFPYGNKSKEVLLKRAYYLSKCLIEQGVELIILACNTLSILAYSFLKYNLKIPVIGVFDYFIPYLTPNHTLIGSKTTIAYAKEKYQVQVIDGTDFIEAIEKKKDISIYLEELKGLKTELLLLGCTHFLAIPSDAYPLPTLNQIPMLLEDIKKAREIEPLS
ncbi:MAG: hypothetical protein K2M08_03110 [Anaeroplasmataceae bacterium]|nr:hypothetical protein [Anaeroplasmataceae bacterium]